MTTSDGPRRLDLTARTDTATLGSELAGRLTPFMSTAGGEPMITYVDHSTDDRTELSGATVANWAAKFANLAAFEMPEAGVVGLRTDGHWAAVPVAIGAWRLGMGVKPSLTPDPRGATATQARGHAADLTVAFAHLAGPDDLAVGPGLGGRLIPPGTGLGPQATGLGPQAARRAPKATRLRPFVEDVLAEPDDVDADDPDPVAVALIMAAASAGDADAAPPADLSALAGELAGIAGMGGRRTLLLDPVDSVPGLVALAACLLHGGSLLIVRNPDADRLPRLVENEKADVVAATAAHDDIAASLPVATHLRLR